MTLYEGDCFNVLPQCVIDESVDLIYIDPPFYTDRNFAAFDARFESMDVYIGWLKFRIRECYDALKPTGSIYVHCDWHTARYIGVMLDGIFGYDNFRNEIIWCYMSAGYSKKQFARKHDTIWFYSKSDEYTFNADDVRVPYTDPVNILSSKTGSPAKTAKVYGFDWYAHPDGKLSEDWWYIPNLNSVAKERNGYDTQKPEALLERIIKASSNEGDMVLDPMCGSGTAPAVANRLHREFIGIDINPDAIKLAEKRTKTQQQRLIL